MRSKTLEQELILLGNGSLDCLAQGKTKHGQLFEHESVFIDCKVLMTWGGRMLNS